MVTYILLVNFTDEGIRSVKKSPDRVKALDAEAEKLGMKIKERYWTVGAYDFMLIAEAPNDEAMATLALGIGSRGHVRTQTLRAFSASEFERILANVR